MFDKFFSHYSHRRIVIFYSSALFYYINGRKIRFTQYARSCAVSAAARSLVCAFVCANAFSSMSAKIFDLAVASEIFHISELHHPHSVLPVCALCGLMHNALSEEAKGRCFHVWSSRHESLGQKWWHDIRQKCAPELDTRSENTGTLVKYWCEKFMKDLFLLGNG